MALRVLLADESSTIKKVFQLALQDFAVEVRPVNVGVDVAPVAQTFKPDIIFADVLLQKRSGYDVAAEIKQDPALKSIPVVLMWSGFMELDEDKFQACMANAQLEKPFDVTALRKLITDLVPRTQNQRLSQFLNFPKMPEMDMAAPAAPAPSAAAPPPAPPEISADDFAAPETFKQVPLPKMKGGSEKYRINLKPEELEPEHVPVDYDMPSEKLQMDEVLKVNEVEEEPFAIKETKRSKPKGPPPGAPPIPRTDADDAAQDLMMEDETPSPLQVRAETQMDIAAPGPAAAPQMSAEQLEKIIREQSAEVIESVVWKVVPDLAAQIIERELNKLLKERESQPY